LWRPKPDQHLVDLEELEDILRVEGEQIAMIMVGGVNYYTGQYLNIPEITRLGHEHDIIVGFDLAHATGNVDMKLHDWDVDFAAWCSYKYLNSGPGGVAGAFIHQKHIANKNLPRLAGWWGYEKATRFQMEKGFKPIATAEGWQLSNAPVLSMAAHKASLDIFEDAGMDNLLAKGKMLSDYLFFIIEELNKNAKEKLIEVITPKDAKGCQVSMLMLKKGKEVFEALKQNGVIADWREPNVIRVAPVPLYNSFEDIWKFGEIVNSILKYS
jgi:kynureninase